MKIRFGYVALSKLMDVTTNKTTTYTHYKTLNDDVKRDKLLSLTKQNIMALLDILKYNVDQDIHFYRITSSLIPLATHPDVLWDFTCFEKELKEVGDYIKMTGMRVDMHPDQFNVLNSTKAEVVQNTIVNLEYHNKLLNIMGLVNEPLILHVGSKVDGIDKAKKRFIKNFALLSDDLKRRLIIENDDKVFNTVDVLDICETLGIPFVYDHHHHKCNPVPHIKEYIPRILNTWQDRLFSPKVHLSSPKDGLLERSHADFINPDDFYDLINLFKKANQDFDIMIEAKMKDVAMFQLLKDIKGNFEFIDQTTIKM